MISSTTDLKILSGSANPALGESIAQKLGVELVPLALERFADSELHVEVQESVRGHDVYVVNSSCSPVDEHIVELLFVADACARAGASRLTAVIPYCGYARQDRRAHGREAVGGRVMANLICAVGLQHVVAVDLHSAAIEGMFSIPLEHLTAVPLLAEAVRPWIAAKTVVVAPDLGAVKLAERYGRTLHLPVVIVHKMRLSGSEVTVQSIIGEVKSRAILIVDDMISTGGTVEAAIKALLAAGCASDFMVVASHGLFAGSAVERMQDLPIRRLFVTDSVPVLTHAALPLEIVSLAPVLAQTIERLHKGRSLADLIWHG
jgi:ribose-phosphate pyrophosphokinase